MKNPQATIIIVTLTRVIRADLDGALRNCRVESRPAGTPLGESVVSALASSRTPQTVWILSDEVFTQDVSLNPAQIAGLSPEHLARALSFEVEPFSGIPVADSAVGFRDKGAGRFSVVEIPRFERTAIETSLAVSGTKLAGIAHAGVVPEDTEALDSWLNNWQARLTSNDIAFIAPSAPVPSPHRFLAVAIALEAAAVLLLLAIAGWQGAQRKSIERQQVDLAGPSSQLSAAKKLADALKAELDAMNKSQAMRDRVVARRGALLALLKNLAATRPEDVVVRGIQADGPSNVIVSGLSLDASAVDELSIVLTQSLRGAGWTAQPRHKSGKDKLRNGGPWEFSLTLTHEEATQTPGIALNNGSLE